MSDFENLGVGCKINALRRVLADDLTVPCAALFPANKSLERFRGACWGNWGRIATAQLSRSTASVTGCGTALRNLISKFSIQELRLPDAPSGVSNNS